MEKENINEVLAILTSMLIDYLNQEGGTDA